MYISTQKTSYLAKNFQYINVEKFTPDQAVRFLQKNHFFPKQNFFTTTTICVMVCVYFLPWYVHTLQFVGVCTLGFQRHKWKFSNSAIQTFLDRLSCISQWKSVWERGNWSVQTFLVFVLYLYLCLTYICFCICANFHLYL